MRRSLPILALLAGLGSFISSNQTVEAQAKSPLLATAEVDPFSRYLSFEKAHRSEPALSRFATSCGMDLASVKRRYAQRPKDAWNLVPDLSRAMDDQETDFYGTVSVLHQSDLILVERWGMELDTGDYFRLLYCLSNKQVTLAESVIWRLAGFGDGTDSVTWGYEHRWKLGHHGKLETDPARFINLEEMPMQTPKLDDETVKSLKNEGVGVKNWADLDLPDALQR